MMWCNHGLYTNTTYHLFKKVTLCHTCHWSISNHMWPFSRSPIGHFTYPFGLNFPTPTPGFFSTVIPPSRLHLRIVSSWEVQWRSLEDVDLWKVSRLTKGGPTRRRWRVGSPMFKSINRKQGEGWNNDEIQDGLRWTKLMNTVSLGKVFNKSECYVNQNYWNVYIERSQPKNGSPVAGRFDVTHHILSNQAIWHDFVVVVVQGLTKIIGTTIPERFPILYSPVLWESILGCHPRGQKWKSNVWSWRELYQHKDMMFCMKNYRLLSKVTSIVCESTNLKTKQQIEATN